MSNRRRIDLEQLARVLAKPRAPRPQPERRVRACCPSRQGDSHGPSCTRPGKGWTPVQLREMTPDEARANQAWLDSDTVRSRVDALPDGEIRARCLTMDREQAAGEAERHLKAAQAVLLPRTGRTTGWSADIGHWHREAADPPGMRRPEAVEAGSDDT